MDANNWISVKERMPKEKKEIIGFDGTRVGIAAYGGYDEEIKVDVWYGISHAMSTITHWMPLPGAPVVEG